MKLPKRKPPFIGVGTALATPFADGAVDFPALGGMIDYQISENIDALILCGTTAETPTLTKEEYEAVVAFGAERIGGRVPCIVGCGSSDTKSTVERAKFARKSGADALLVVTPYYNRGTRAGRVRHYAAIADETGLPIILYHVPGRTGVRLTAEDMAEIAEHPLICGIKEASGDMDLFADLAAKLGDTLALYTGNDSLLLPSLSLGGQGGISVISNLLPRRTGDICRAFFAGNCDFATEIHLNLLPLMRLLFAEVNPAPLKHALSLQGQCRGELRLPLDTVDTKLQQALATEWLRLDE